MNFRKSLFSQQDKKKSEEGNSCMVSNQPTLVELLHKSNIQVFQHQIFRLIVVQE